MEEQKNLPMLGINRLLRLKMPSLGLTAAKKEVSKQMGISTGTLVNWIAGRTPISKGNLMLLCQILKCEKEELYHDK